MPDMLVQILLRAGRVRPVTHETLHIIQTTYIHTSDVSLLPFINVQSVSLLFFNCISVITHIPLEQILAPD